MTRDPQPPPPDDAAQSARDELEVERRLEADHFDVGDDYGWWDDWRDAR